MAFFDELKHNASDVVNKAAKKTTELTGMAKLQVQIKSNETKLSSVYEEIGCMFYNAERSGLDSTSEIANCIMKADKIKAEIAVAKAELAKLRKVTVCEGCGAEIADNVAFCPCCGMKQIKPEPEIDEESDYSEEEVNTCSECEDECTCEDTSCCCENTCVCKEECTCENNAETCDCSCSEENYNETPCDNDGAEEETDTE